jgi:iron complex outermembrane receptor protein
LRITYGDNHWSFAVRGSYRKAKNYNNSIDGSVYNTGFRETNASFFGAYTSKYGYSNLNLSLYNNIQGIPDGSRDSLTRKFTKQVYEIPFDDVKNRPVVSDIELNSYQMSPLHQHIEHYRVYSNNHYKVGKGEMDVLLAFQQNIRREFNHPTAPFHAGLFVRLNTLNYGIRYDAPVWQDIEISIGVNGMYQNNKNKDATDFPIPDYRLFDAGAYTHAKWKYKKWTASGGLRYDTRFLSGENFYTRMNPNTGFNKQVYATDTTDAYLLFPSFRKTFSGMSLSIGTTFQLTHQITMKANVASGYRAPNITEFASNGLDPGAHIVYLGNRNFIPEFSLQEDFGISGNFKSVSFNVSIFNNNIQHYIYLTQLTDAGGKAVVVVPGNKTFQYQQSTAQLYGLEASLEVRPEIIKGFRFNNSVSMIYGFNRKSEYKNQGVNGAFLPLIPPLKLFSSINQSFKTKYTHFPVFSLKIEADCNAAQSRYLASDHTETSTPPYSLLNIAAGAEIVLLKKSTLQIQIQVNNLLDVAYQSNLSRLKYFEYYLQSPNGHLGMYSIGRNFCFKLVLPF